MSELDPPAPGLPQPDGPLYDASYVNTMIHFYRGELGRIMIWRQRLDITTTWAITSTTTIFTVAFTVEKVPHIIFFFNLLIVWMMLWIEARRYRFYDAFRARVRMLEAHFILPMVIQNKSMLQGNWQKLICEDLLLPSFKISRFEAVGRRLKRNYGYIFMVILIAWLTKIFLHSPEGGIGSFPDFYRALEIGHFPGWITLVTFIGAFVFVIGTSIYIARKSSGEVTEFGNHRSLWRI